MFHCLCRGWNLKRFSTMLKHECVNRIMLDNNGKFLRVRFLYTPWSDFMQRLILTPCLKKPPREFPCDMRQNVEKQHGPVV